MKISACMLFVVLLHGSVASPVSGQASQEGWTVTVAALNTGKDRGPYRTLWVGFTNVSQQARLACVRRSFSYQLGRIDGDRGSGAGSATGASHQCLGDEDFQLVLPSDTLFHPFVVTSSLWQDDTTLRVQPVVITRDARGNEERTNLAWTGTVKDIVAVGKSLGF
jgi:hypothetical protein